MKIALLQWCRNCCQNLTIFKLPVAVRLPVKETCSFGVLIIYTALFVLKFQQFYCTGHTLSTLKTLCLNLKLSETLMRHEPFVVDNLGNWHLIYTHILPSKRYIHTVIFTQLLIQWLILF